MRGSLIAAAAAGLILRHSQIRFCRSDILASSNSTRGAALRARVCVSVCVLCYYILFSLLFLRGASSRIPPRAVCVWNKNFYTHQAWFFHERIVLIVSKMRE